MAFAPVIRRSVASVPPYKSAIFFENSAEQRAAIIERCPTVKVIKERLDEAPADTKFIMVDIPETEPLGLSLVNSLPFYDPYNEYVVKNRLVSESYDSVSGIQKRHIDNILLPWIASRGEGPHVAIFDWDRTTTVIEGLRMHRTGTGAEYIGGDPTQYYVDMLTHLCGGDIRFGELQAMFQQLLEANIHIMFLTNNPSGNYPMFDEMIQVLVGATKPAYSIIVSNSIAYNGVKANVFSMVQQFSELACKKRPVVLAPIRSTSVMPSSFSSFAPLPENPYYGGRRRTRRKRKSKTLRRIMRGALRRMRRKRTKRCD